MTRTTQQPARPSTTDLIRLTTIVTLTVLVVIGLVFLLFKVRTILLWVLIGIILAIALQPVVGWLQRHGWNRILASLLVSLLTVVIIAGAVVAIAWPVVLQADDFIRALPNLVDSLFGTGGPLNFLEVNLHVVERLKSVTPEQVVHVIMGNQASIVSAVSRVASLIAATITILTIMVMMLIEGQRAWQSVLGIMVGEERKWTERIGDNFLRATGGYVRGNLAISVVAGIASYIVLKIMGVPYAETLAVLVAILDVVPLVGATIGAVIVCIVGFATSGTVDGIVLVVFFVLYQQFENNVLQNLVYSKTVSLSPLVVFIAALVGASLMGIVGVLLAIPLASAGWVLGRDLLALRKARHLGGVGPEGLEAIELPGDLPVGPHADTPGGDAGTGGAGGTYASGGGWKPPPEG
jgi:predicted PurR-regulated permease PerM